MAKLFGSSCRTGRQGSGHCNEPQRPRARLSSQKSSNSHMVLRSPNSNQALARALPAAPQAISTVPNKILAFPLRYGSAVLGWGLVDGAHNPIANLVITHTLYQLDRTPDGIPGPPRVDCDLAPEVVALTVPIRRPAATRPARRRLDDAELNILV